MDAVNAALWDKLPTDAVSVASLYRDALGKDDFRTLNAIEAMPSVFEGHLDAATLADLQRERIAVEAPDVAKAINLGEELVALVDGAHNAVASHLVDLGRELPDPEDVAEAVVGGDGLRTLSGSQFQEAIG